MVVWIRGTGKVVVRLDLQSIARSDTISCEGMNARNIVEWFQYVELKSIREFSQEFMSIRFFNSLLDH